MRLSNNIDKFGTAGLFLTAIFSPCCFPLFAFTASALGLGSFELFGGWTMWILGNGFNFCERTLFLIS